MKLLIMQFFSTLFLFSLSQVQTFPSATRSQMSLYIYICPSMRETSSIIKQNIAFL